MTPPRHALAAVALAAFAMASTPARSREGFESVSAVPAASALPAATLEGPHHRVGSEAQRDDAMLRFRVESDYGERHADPETGLAAAAVIAPAAAGWTAVGRQAQTTRAQGARVRQPAVCLDGRLHTPRGHARRRARRLRPRGAAALRAAPAHRPGQGRAGPGGPGPHRPSDRTDVARASPAQGTRPVATSRNCTPERWVSPRTTPVAIPCR